MGCPYGFGDLTAGAVALVHPVSSERGQGCLVTVETLGLDQPGWVEVEPESYEVVDLASCHGQVAAGRVEVLDAEQEATLGGAGHHPGDDRGPQVPQM